MRRVELTNFVRAGQVSSTERVLCRITSQVTKVLLCILRGCDALGFRAPRLAWNAVSRNAITSVYCSQPCVLSPYG